MGRLWRCIPRYAASTLDALIPQDYERQQLVLHDLPES